VHLRPCLRPRRYPRRGPHPDHHPEETLAAIEAVLGRWSGYEALGIASFGPVSIDPAAENYGFITATTKPGWSNTDVGRRLARHAGVPLGFNSDVAGAALGEGRWGAARDVADHAYVTVGTGIGVGLIMGGEPSNGLTHPELGHIRPVRLAGDDWRVPVPSMATVSKVSPRGRRSGRGQGGRRNISLRTIRCGTASRMRWRSLCIRSC
jgi:predicted NBD/HSP70 family sugar kinase